MNAMNHSAKSVEAALSPCPLSLVIRTLDCASTLEEVLTQIKPRPDDQLIVVDSGSKDGTLAVAEQFGALTVEIRPEDFTYGRSLNVGFARASRDWVLSLSSHCLPTRPDFLDQYRRAVRRFPANLAAAVGPILYSELDRKLGSGITLYELEDFAAGFGFGAGNPNCLYRRALWQQRPFDEQIPGAEDMEWYVWALRQGACLGAVQAADVLYVSQRPLSALYRKGRLDYRFSSQFIHPHQPRLSVVGTHLAKLVLYMLLGRIRWSQAARSFANYLGSYRESRAPRGQLEKWVDSGRKWDTRVGK
jgi:glycosyltransferase involved in cell wall biosynthesis